jgi:DNA-binding NarL/FixJ family response regulator
MPKVDGVEVLRRIKTDRELKKMPVIMLTTTDEAEEIDRCYKMGCSFYIHKPADYGRFMAAVENLGRFISLAGIRLARTFHTSSNRHTNIPDFTQNAFTSRYRVLPLEGLILFLCFSACFGVYM